MSTQEPQAHRLQLSPETPALLFFPWHSPHRPDPWDLEPVCITIGDALPWTRYKGSRQAVLSFKWELNWTSRKAVGITDLLLFVKEKKNHVKLWQFRSLNFCVWKSLCLNSNPLKKQNKTKLYPWRRAKGRQKTRALGSLALLCQVPNHLVARIRKHASMLSRDHDSFGGTGIKTLQRKYSPICLHRDPSRTSTWVVFSISTAVPRVWEGIVAVV